MDINGAGLLRQDFKLSGSRYYLGIFTIGILLAGLIFKAIHAILPGYPLIAVGLSLFAAIIVVPASIFWGLRSISTIDFNKPALSIDHAGVHIHDVRVLHLPKRTPSFVAWNHISKMRYETSGRYNQTKYIVIYSPPANPDGIWIVAGSLASVDARDLFETMRYYRRTIAPLPTDEIGPNTYHASSWTGLDDEG